MSFVDRSRFSEGVSFDSKNQLIHFAHSTGKVDPLKVAKAVKDAGFEAVFLYENRGGKIVKINLGK